MSPLRRLLLKIKLLLYGPNEGHSLGQLATALAKANSFSEMVKTVCEQCKEVLGADAICLYLSQPGGAFEMAYEIGCTYEFKSQWKIITKDVFPMFKGPRLEENLFFGSAQEFQQDLPMLTELLKKSGRHTIAYGLLIVNQDVIGILGFSYNRKQRHLWNRDFVKVLLNLCAFAIDRIRLFEQEQIARREAEDANTSKNDFLANISHEIRTPAGAVQGFADLLADSKGLTAQQRRWASIIRKNTLQLTDIIGEVLDISKIEAKATEFHPVRVNLIGQFEDLQATFEPIAQQKGLVLIFDYSGCSRYILTDALQLRQMLINLIGNAIKFTLNGSVTVKARTGHGRLQIWVTDTGIGVADEKRERIFEPFVQAESSTSRRFGGSGLGLAIAKKLAKIQGGDLTLLTSAAGQGSTFLLDIPAQTLASIEVEINERGSNGRDAKLNGIDVLLVEDFVDNQELIKHLLEKEGAHVEVADSGDSGVSMAMNREYDVILMDIQMPEMDGYEVVSILRKRGYKRSIAALTAHALHSEKTQSAEKGFDAYLTKPINLPALLDTVKRLSRPRRTWSPSL